MGIYLTFKKDFSIVNLIKIIAIIYINTLFRIETGLFLVVLIPAYLLLTLQSSKYKTLVFTFSGLMLFVLFVISVSYINQIQALFASNQEAYVEGITEGSGIIATFQRIPIIGDFISIIYNAAQPLPFWARLEYSGKGSLGPEVYNIMNFPSSFAAFFNMSRSVSASPRRFSSSAILLVSSLNDWTPCPGKLASPFCWYSFRQRYRRKGAIPNSCASSETFLRSKLSLTAFSLNALSKCVLCFLIP